MKAVLTPEEREQVARALRGRILNVLPAATYQMDHFLKIVDVVVSDRSETACVETGSQPRLHLNARFVEKRCKRDEHLLMLILHELYHIILGHTRLFPRLTQAHNIAFDAVINSMLCHQFKEAVYVEFFQKLNPWSRFPGRLLRPPPGWPGASKPLPSNATAEEEAVMGLLYGKRSKTVTYHEIFELLRRQLKSEDSPKYTLLGDHGGSEGEGEKDATAVNDERFKAILGRVLEGWPQKANVKAGRCPGGGILDYLLPKPRSPRREFLEALRSLLRKTGVLRPDARSPYAWQRQRYGIETVMALPNWRDRQAHSREILLGEAPLLYKAEVQVNRARWTPQNITHVYIDVSGSMEDSLPWLAGALDPLHRRGLCRLYAFSTVVDEVKRGKLLSGKIKNTFGTDINCVYRHLVEFSIRRTPTRVVVLTDGYTGVPEPQLNNECERRKVSLYVGLVGNCQEPELKPFARLVERLPELE